MTRLANNNNSNENGSADGHTVTISAASTMVEVAATNNFRGSMALPENSVSLSNYLSRITKVGSFDWLTASSSVLICELYATWIADEAIAPKLLGYRYFRAKPKLIVVVNGFSTYYGKLLITYDPNPGPDGRDLDTTSTTLLALEHFSQAWQSPHIEIDPSMSQTYELDMPFYSTMEWYDLYPQGPGAALTPKLYIVGYVMNQLRNVNDIAVDSVNMQVYVQMMDVELSTPCFPYPEALLKHQGPEGKVKKTETMKKPMVEGVLSGPLSAVRKVTSYVESIGGGSIPYIGPFLSPFNAASEKAISFLQFLGYASPAKLDFTATYNTSNSLRMVCNGPDASKILRNDLKGSLAIDAAAATVGTDNDMLVSFVASKPGFISKIVWSTTLGISATIPVTPRYCLDDTSSYFICPLAHVSLAHQFWSGSLVYTIEVVCSQYHRGAIGISWVPFVAAAPPTFADFPNRYLTVIMDITQDRAIDFVVPFASSTNNLRVNDYGAVLESAASVNDSNGNLYIYEINPLKTMGSTSSVDVNVYVRGGDDYVLYMPTTAHIVNFSFIEPPALQVEETPATELVHQGPASADINQDQMEGRSLLFFGERSISIKDICNKPMFMGEPTGATAIPYIQFSLPIDPPHMESLDNPSFIGWFAPAYLAQRGGYRFKIVNVNPSTTASNDQSRTGRFAFINYVPLLTPMVKATLANILDKFDFSGGYIFYRTADGGATEIEVPFINLNRFSNPRELSYDANSLATSSLYEVVINNGITIATERNLVFASAADDYSLHGYYVAPRLFVG